MWSCIQDLNYCVEVPKVDAKFWQIAKAGIVWAGIVWEVELEKVETVEPPLSKMLKAMEAAPLETQLMDQWKEEQVAELMGLLPWRSS
jgi:hypothetical protein